MVTAGWDFRLQAALGWDIGPGLRPQLIALIVKPLAANYMKALAYKAPSTLLLSSLQAAIRNSNTFAAQALLKAPDSLSAVAVSKSPYEDSRSIVEQTLQSCLPMDRRNMLKLITQAFADQNRPDLVVYAASGALTVDDAALFTWQLQVMLEVCSRSELSVTLAQTVQFNRLQQLQQMLALPGDHWLEHQLEPALAAAAGHGSAEAVRLLLDAIPHWSNTTLAAALGYAATLEVAQLLLHAATVPWTPVELIGPLCILVTALAKLEIVQIVSVVVAAAAGQWTMAQLAVVINGAARLGVPDVLSLLLDVSPIRPSFDLLTAAMVAAMDGLNHPTLAVLVTKVDWSSCQLSMLSEVVVEAVKSARMDLLQLLLQAPPQRWLPGDLAAAATEAASIGNGGMLREVLQAAHEAGHGAGVWSPVHLSSALSAAVQGGQIAVIKAVLSAAVFSTGPTASRSLWRPQDLLQAAGDALTLRNHAALQAILQAAPAGTGGWVKWQTLGLAATAVQLRESALLQMLLASSTRGWTADDLKGLLCTIARGRCVGLDVVLKQLQTATGGLGSRMSTLKAGLVEAVSASCPNCLEALIAAAPRAWQASDLVDAAVVAVQLGHKEALKLVLGACSKAWQPALLLPVVSAAAKSPDLSLATEVLSAAPARRWQGWMVKDVLCAAVDNKSSGLIEALLQAVDEWQPADLEDALGEAAAQGDAVLVGTFLAAAVFPWQPLHLAPAVFMAVKSKAGLGMLRTLLAATAGDWKVGNLKEAVAEAARGPDALHYVGELLKATEQEEWQPDDLADAAEEAVRYQWDVLRVLLEAPKEGCKAWQDTQLLKRLFTAAARTGCWALAGLQQGLGDLQLQPEDVAAALVEAVTRRDKETLQLLLDLPQGGVKAWQPQLLVPVLIAAVREGAYNLAWQLLGVGAGRWEAEQLEAVLWEAAKAGDMTFVQMVLRAANDWHQAYLSEAIKEAVQEGDLGMVKLLLQAGGPDWRSVYLEQGLQAAVRQREEQYLSVLLLAAKGRWSHSNIAAALAEADKIGLLNCRKALLAAAAATGEQ